MQVRPARDRGSRLGPARVWQTRRDAAPGITHGMHARTGTHVTTHAHGMRARTGTHVTIHAHGMHTHVAMTWFT